MSEEPSSNGLSLQSRKSTFGFDKLKLDISFGQVLSLESASKCLEVLASAVGSKSLVICVAVG